MTEHRFILTQEDLKTLSPKFKVEEIAYIIDHYSGQKRTRCKDGQRTERDYPTPVKGTIYRLSGRLTIDKIRDAYLEFKWTDKVSRCEIEFEGEIHPRFKGRKEITGWDILA